MVLKGSIHYAKCRLLQKLRKTRERTLVKKNTGKRLGVLGIKDGSTTPFLQGLSILREPAIILGKPIYTVKPVKIRHGHIVIPGDLAIWPQQNDPHLKNRQ